MFGGTMGILLLVGGIALFFTKIWVVGVIDLLLLALFARGEFWYKIGSNVDISELLESLGEIDWSDIGSDGGGFGDFGGGGDGGGE